jgi:hypothetical protein
MAGMAGNRFFRMRHVALLVLALAAGCVYTESPLADDEDSLIDEELIGQWWVEDDGGKITIKLNDQGDRPVLEAFDSAEPDIPTRWYCTKIGDKRFVTWNIASEGDEHRYVLVRYEIRKHNTLIWSELKRELVNRAIRSGEIHGDPKGMYAVISDKRERLRAFIEKHADDGFETLLELTRCER